MKKDFMTKTIVVVLGAMICSLLWGSAFPCIKIGYDMMHIGSGDTATQILYAGYRFTLAGILAILIGSVSGRKFLYPRKSAFPKVALLALFQTVLQYLFFYIGLANTSGTKASIIEGMNVFMAILISGLLFRLEKVDGQKIIGCLVGFAGVVFVNLNGGQLDLALHLTGEGFIFFSTISYAFSTVLLKRYSKEENTVMLSGWQFALGGLFMILTGFLLGGKLERFTVGSAGMLIYLALVSAIAYSLWSLLLTYNPVSKVAVFGFMNPMFGFVLSAVLLQESNALSLRAFVSLGLVCAGIYIVNKEKKHVVVCE